jgi:hypothetical protein
MKIVRSTFGVLLPAGAGVSTYRAPAHQAALFGICLLPSYFGLWIQMSQGNRPDALALAGAFLLVALSFWRLGARVDATGMTVYHFLWTRRIPLGQAARIRTQPYNWPRGLESKRLSVVLLELPNGKGRWLPVAYLNRHAEAVVAALTLDIKSRLSSAATCSHSAPPA